MKKFNVLKINRMTSVFVLAISLAFFGCGPNALTQKSSDLQYQSGNPDTNTGNGSNGGETETIDFAKVKNEVFAARCFRCHNSGSLNFAVEDSIFNNLNSIKSEIESGSMPEDGPLTAHQMRIFKSWIQLGSPR